MKITGATKLAELPLSYKARNALRDFQYVREVWRYSDVELLEYPNFGRVSLAKLRELVGYGPKTQADVAEEIAVMLERTAELEAVNERLGRRCNELEESTKQLRGMVAGLSEKMRKFEANAQQSMRAAFDDDKRLHKRIDELATDIDMRLAEIETELDADVPIVAGSSALSRLFRS